MFNCTNTSLFFSWWRTKWKRQTAVGLELLAEAGNYSALQRMFPSPYFYPQSLVSNLDPGAALYLYRGPSAPPPALQRPLVPRILLHGLQGHNDPPPLPPLSGVLPRPTPPRWAARLRLILIHGSFELHQKQCHWWQKYPRYKATKHHRQNVVRDIFQLTVSTYLIIYFTLVFNLCVELFTQNTDTNLYSLLNAIMTSHKTTGALRFTNVLLFFKYNY